MFYLLIIHIFIKKLCLKTNPTPIFFVINRFCFQAMIVWIRMKISKLSISRKVLISKYLTAEIFKFEPNPTYIMIICNKTFPIYSHFKSLIKSNS